MPRHGPYPVVLSAEEAHVSTARAAQHTRSYFEVQRAKMILVAAEDGPTTRSPAACRRAGRSSHSGGNASTMIAWLGWMIVRARA